MTSDSTPPPVVRTPLPKFQIFIIFLVQLAEPITASVIYPFAPEFVRRTGITGGDETKTGYYAGLIESAFFVAESLSVYHWGRAADYFGRRPILLLGPLGVSLAMLGFGLSTNFWFLVLFRCLQGVFNGNIGVTKTVLGELTDSTNIGDVFAVMPLIWGLGSTSGPIIGGLLADPGERWPIFKRLPLFRDHPYLLPCLVSSSMAFGFFLVTFISLKETLPSAVARKKEDASTPLLRDSPDLDYGAVSEEMQPPPPLPRTPTFKEIANRRLVLVILNYCFVSFTSTSYEVLQPLMYSTSIPVGGLGLSPYEIGLIMFAWGTVNALLQVFLTSWIIRKFGARRAFTQSAAFLMFSFCAFSLESYFARKAGYIDWRVMTLMGVQLTCSLMVYTAYGAAHVLVVQTATSREALGSTNGLAQMANSGTRGFAPYIASSLFSLTLQHNLAGGFFVYGVFVILMGLSVWSSMRVR